MEFVQIAIDYKPLNLGQGLPDDLVPEFVIDELNEVVKEHTNPLHQYTRGFVSFDKNFFQNSLMHCRKYSVVQEIFGIFWVNKFF